MALVDYFLKIDGIDGESQDAKYKNHIHVHSWSLGVTNTATMATGGGGGGGKAAFDDVTFVMPVSKASPKLKLACAGADHIKKAELFCCKAGKDKQEFLKYTFTDVIVSSYHTGGAGSADIIPTDQISLNYAKIETEYKAQKADGTLDGGIKSGWNLKEGKKV